MSYATLADLQDFLPKYGILDTTVPSATQAQGYLDRTSSIIDGILAGQGYSVPVSGAESIEILRHINLLAAGYWITRILFPSATNGMVTELWTEYQTMFQLLKDQVLDLPDAPNDPENVALTASDISTDDPRCDWFTTHPFVTRGMQF